MWESTLVVLAPIGVIVTFIFVCQNLKRKRKN